MAIADYHSLHKAAAHLNSNASTLKTVLRLLKKKSVPGCFSHQLKEASLLRQEKDFISPLQK